MLEELESDEEMVLEGCAATCLGPAEAGGQYRLGVGDRGGAEELVGEHHDLGLIEFVHAVDEGRSARDRRFDLFAVHRCAGIDQENRSERKVTAGEGDQLLGVAFVGYGEHLAAQIEHPLVVASHRNVELLQLDLVIGRDRSGPGGDCVRCRIALHVPRHHRKPVENVFFTEVDVHAERLHGERANGAAVKLELDL